MQPALQLATDLSFALDESRGDPAIPHKKKPEDSLQQLNRLEKRHVIYWT